MKRNGARDRVTDEPLRVRALDMLGPHGDELAREALEAGSVSVEHDVLAWEGTSGTVHGHRVIVTVAAALHARVTKSHAAGDGLAGCLAAAMAERAGHAVADVRVEVGDLDLPPMSGPYRVPRAS